MYGEHACICMELYVGEDVLAEKPIYTFIFINKNTHVYKNILETFNIRAGTRI